MWVKLRGNILFTYLGSGNLWILVTLGTMLTLLIRKFISFTLFGSWFFFRFWRTLKVWRSSRMRGRWLLSRRLTPPKRIGVYYPRPKILAPLRTKSAHFLALFKTRDPKSRTLLCNCNTCFVRPIKEIPHPPPRMYIHSIHFSGHFALTWHSQTQK